MATGTGTANAIQDVSAEQSPIPGFFTHRATSIPAEPVTDPPVAAGLVAKLLAKRHFAAVSSRSPLEEPLEVGPVNDEALARHSG